MASDISTHNSMPYLDLLFLSKWYCTLAVALVANAAAHEGCIPVLLKFLLEIIEFSSINVLYSLEVILWNRQSDEITRNDARYMRGDNYGPFQLYLAAGNPCNACIFVQTYYCRQQPVWKTAIEDQALFRGYGREWQVIGL